MKSLFALVLFVSGCTHTLTARTGRVLEAGQMRGLVAGGAVHVAEPLALYQIDAVPDRETSTERDIAYPTTSWAPQGLLGGKLGLGGGWEANAGVILPGFLGGTAGIRKGMVDTPRFAMALSIDGTISYFNVADGGAGTIRILTGRATVDLSAHMDWFAVYASPGWMTLAHTHTLHSDDESVSESTSVGLQMVGGAGGFRLGRTVAAYVEVGYWRTLDSGKAIIAPVIGVELAPEPPSEF